MYIEQDFVGPATLDLQANRKMHNRLLRYWPTKLVNDVEVMDRLYMYKGSVLDTDNHRKIYNILGVSIEDLKKENWKGVDSYWMYFKVVQGTYDDVTNTQLDTYLQFRAPFTEKSVPEAPENDRSVWLESELSYEPLKVDSLSNALSDSEIIAKIIANPYIIEYSTEDEHVLTSLALLDVDEVIFEREFRVTYKGLTTVTFTSQTSVDNTASFIKEANLEFKFRRKPETTQLAYDAYLSSIRTAIYNSVNAPYGSVYIQLLSVYHGIVPFVDNEILYTELYETGIGLEVAGASYYRKDGLQAMKSKEFNKTITSRIKTKYKKKKVSRWKKFVTVVVVVIIVIVAVLAGQPQIAGGAIQWGSAALVLTVGSLAMLGLSMVLAKRDPAWATYIGKSSQVLGIAATAVGVVAIIQNLARAVAASSTQALNEAEKQLIKEGVVGASKEAIKQKALEMAGQLSFKEALKEVTFDNMQNMLVESVKSAWNSATSFNMQKMLNATTTSFQIYAKYIDPPDDGLDDMEKKVEKQEKELEDLSSAGLKDKIDYTFSSPFYNIYDFNEVMQAVPHRMTQGKVDDAFNKYYDGTTSKASYRGYLG